MNEELKIIITAETNKLKQELEKGKKQIEGFTKKVENVQKKYKESFGKIGEANSKFLKSVTKVGVAGAAALGGIVVATKESRESMAKLSTAFESAGGSAATAKETYNGLYRVLGDSGAATTAASSLAALTTNQKDLQQWTTICQGVYAKFGDSLPIDGLAEAANESAKVGKVTGSLADALNWAGVSEDEFNAKLAACNSTAEKEKMIRETLNGVYQESAAEYEKNAEDILKQNEAQAQLQESLNQIGAAFAPIVAQIAVFVSDVLSQLTPHIQAFAEQYGPAIKDILEQVGKYTGIVIGFIVDNWNIIGPLAGVLTAISVAIGLINAVMAVSPVTWIILGIVAAIALLSVGIIALVKHWDDIKEAVKNAVDKIKEKVTEMKNKVIEIFNVVIEFFKNNWKGILLLIINPFAGAFKLAYDNCEGFRNKVNSFIDKVKSLFKTGFEKVKDFIVTPIRAAKDKVRDVVDGIKGLFNFKVSLPHIPTPHFGISPQGWKVGDLLKGKIPKLHINWYAQGGVFDSPTLFGYGNNLGGLGEAGAEAIVPLEKNTEWLDKIAERLAGRRSDTPIVLNVDGKTFAQTSIDTINNLTTQTGKLKLKIV